MDAAYLLVLSVVPNDAGEVGPTWSVLVFFLKGCVSEGFLEECPYGFKKLASPAAEPVGLKGPVSKHAAVYINNEDPALLQNAAGAVSGGLHVCGRHIPRGPGVGDWKEHLQQLQDFTRFVEPPQLVLGFFGGRAALPTG